MQLFWIRSASSKNRYKGSRTVKELKHRQADNLAAKMAEINAEKRLCRKSPSPAVVAKWIAQAQTMDAAIRY
jgi:hypothetical protein